LINVIGSPAPWALGEPALRPTCPSGIEHLRPIPGLRLPGVALACAPA